MAGRKNAKFFFINYSLTRTAVCTSMSQAGEEEEIQFHSYVVYLLKPSFKWPMSIIDATLFQTLKKCI